MSLTIVKGSEPITVDQIRMLVFGQPGSGKSSFGFTCETPLMLDFDGGAHRSAFRKDIVRIGQWSDVTQIAADDLKPYQTLVVDTVGRALDYLSTALVEDDPKLATRTGGLTLSGYGALKSAFASWISRINTLGLDVVMVAHDKETTNERDTKIVRPDIQGGSYGEVFKLCDAVGYLYLENRKRVLDFSPTENWVGKNPASFEPISVPDYTANGKFGAELVTVIKESLGQISAEGEKVAKTVQKFGEKLEKVEDAGGLNKAMKALEKLESPAKPQAKKLLHERMKTLECEYDKASKQFVDPEPEETTDDGDPFD